MKTFAEWWEDNHDECWISYHESGSCYDTDYEWYCDHLYDMYCSRKEEHECSGN